jgi:DNA-binding MarR family transcriptional regulator
MDDVSALPLGETFEFLRALWALDHALQKASKRVESALGVTGPQRMVIRIVGRFPGISAGQLARVLHLHPSTLTGILRRLKQRGLLARWPDPRDERRALLGLTARGRGLDTESPGTVEHIVGRLHAEMPPQRVAAALSVLRRLAALLEAGKTRRQRTHKRRRD